MAKENKKRMTARQRLQEQMRKQQEAEKGQYFKKRLVRVRIQTHPFSVLHALNIFYCGYCGKPVALFSSRSFRVGERLPPLYYTCRDKCPRSTAHRADFIDRLLLQLIQKRITENFPKPKSGEHYEQMLEKFKQLEELQSDRLSLLTKLHYASYKRDKILEELRDIDDRIKNFKDEIKSLFNAKADNNPLIYPLFETPPSEINTLDLTYRRELVKTFVRRLRFFNEFLIVRLNPITEEDERKSDEMGRIFHLNLRMTNRGEKINLPENIVQQEDEENETSQDNDKKPLDESEDDTFDFEIADETDITFEE